MFKIFTRMSYYRDILVCEIIIDIASLKANNFPYGKR